MAAERPFDEAFLSDRTDAAFSAVAEPRRADDADVLRRLRGLIAFSKGFNELRGFKDAPPAPRTQRVDSSGMYLTASSAVRTGTRPLMRFGRANVMGDVSE